MSARPKRRVLRWDPYWEPNEDDMEFRLTYAGPLLAHRDDNRLAERSLHVHSIRKLFHKQLSKLWVEHPTLLELFLLSARQGGDPLQRFEHDGFTWLPMVTNQNGLICKLEILMLREGQPGRVLYDVDNRLKTIFDALRKAKGPNELGAGTPQGQQTPELDSEETFFVLLEDDNLITHVAVTTDTLLEEVPNVPRDQAVRLVIDVTVRPYKSTMDNADFI